MYAVHKCWSTICTNVPCISFMDDMKLHNLYDGIFLSKSYKINEQECVFLECVRIWRLSLGLLFYYFAFSGNKFTLLIYIQQPNDICNLVSFEISHRFHLKVFSTAKYEYHAVKITVKESTMHINVSCVLDKFKAVSYQLEIESHARNIVI